MTDPDGRSHRRTTDRRRSVLSASAALAVLGAVAILAAGAMTGCGESRSASSDPATTSTAVAPGRAIRLDPEQADQASVQATADRFASAFASHLHGAPPSSLRDAGASNTLVQRIRVEPIREKPPNKSPRLRPGGVVVGPDGNGWLAATTLSNDQGQDDRHRPERAPLVFRLERRDGRVLVVDVNQGGRE